MHVHSIVGFERALVLGNRHNRLIKNLLYWAQVLFPKEVESLKNITCPYCGRKFKYRHSLYLHLIRGFRHKKSCYYSFQNLVNVVVHEYDRFRLHYMQAGKTMNKCLIIVPWNPNKVVYFKSVKSAFNWWFENVLGVKVDGRVQD